MCVAKQETLPISRRVERASATQTEDSDSILGIVEPKTIKLGIHSFPAGRSTLKGHCKAFTVCGRQVGRWQLYSQAERSLRCLLA